MNSLDFSWQSAVDAKHPTLTYRLYENGQLIVKDIAELKFTLLMGNRPDGDYSYYATAFDPTVPAGTQYDHLRESIPSPAVVVNYVAEVEPQPPKSFRVARA